MNVKEGDIVGIKRSSRRCKTIYEIESNSNFLITGQIDLDRRGG
jgi:hypothetical protein